MNDEAGIPTVPQPLATLDLSSQNRHDSPALELDSLHSLHLLPVLELDDRPTLIIDIGTAGNDPSKALQPIYTNPALLASGELLSLVAGSIHVSSSNPVSLRPYSRFRQWLLKKKHESTVSSRGNSYMYEGFFWSATYIDDKWKIISGLQSFLSPSRSVGISANGNAKADYTKPRVVARNSFDQSIRDEKLEGVGGSPPAPSHAFDTIHRLAQANPEEHAPNLDEKSLSPGEMSPRMGPFDCTRDGCLEAASPHIDYFRAINWSKTSLGAMNQWPQHLCTIVNIVMKDVNPAMIFWGNDVVMIYNEAYIQVLGQVLGVSCMGKSARLAVSDYWGHFEPIIQHVQSTGASVMTHDLPLFLDRHSFLEETFFSFQFMPIMDERGCIAGFYEPIIETTKHKLLERRVNSLMEVGAQTAKARDIKTYWNYVLQTLTANDKVR